MSDSDKPATRRRAVVLAGGLLAAVLAIQSAYALLCTGGSIDVWPPSGEIPPEPVFVLHATGQRSSWVAEVVAGRVYLESEGGRIDLLELRRFEGDRTSVTQIILAPAEPLPSGHDYSLVVEPSPGSGGRTFRPHNRWRVGDPDREVPAFWKSPFLIHNYSRNLGAGPRTRIAFDFVPTEWPVLVLADIGPDSDYYRDRHQLLLFPREERVFLSSGPCGGNFRPVAGKRYLVIFQLMDTGGNVGGGQVHRVSFVAPGTSRKAPSSSP